MAGAMADIPCSGRKNFLLLRVGNLNTNTLSYRVFSQWASPVNSDFLLKFPVSSRRPVRRRLPPQPATKLFILQVYYRFMRFEIPPQIPPLCGIHFRAPAYRDHCSRQSSAESPYGLSGPLSARQMCGISGQFGGVRRVERFMTCRGHPRNVRV